MPFTRLQWLFLFVVVLLCLLQAIDCSDVATRMARIHHDVETITKESSTPRSTHSWCESLGGQHQSGSTKCFFVPSGTALSWIEAENNCRSYGGHLASITASAENDIVYDLYVSQGGRSHGSMWIGSSDQFESDEGTWRWSDGHLIDYDNWYPGEPNNHGNNQHCGVMWRDDKSWDDQDCGQTKPFVCAVDTQCHDLSGVMREGKCFFVPENVASWEQAKTQCRSYGNAHLASIEHEGENDIVYELYKGSGAQNSDGTIWIGYSDDSSLVTGASEGNWKWDDGSTALFSRWDDNEPNNSGGDQDCAVMWKDNKKWDDQQCSGTKRFVCALYTGARTINNQLPIWRSSVRSPVISCDDYWYFWRSEDSYYYYYYFDPQSGYYYYYYYNYDDYYYYFYSTFDFVHAPEGCYDSWWTQFPNVDG